MNSAMSKPTPYPSCSIIYWDDEEGLIFIGLDGTKTRIGDKPVEPTKLQHLILSIKFGFEAFTKRWNHEDVWLDY